MLIEELKWENSVLYGKYIQFFFFFSVLIFGTKRENSENFCQILSTKNDIFSLIRVLFFNLWSKRRLWKKKMIREVCVETHINEN